jgi:hypothetical protein
MKQIYFKLVKKLYYDRFLKFLTNYFYEKNLATKQISTQKKTWL